MNAIGFAGLPGGSEVILILFIILLLFGAKKLPELSRSLGKSMGEFKKGKEDLERELRDVEKTTRAAVEEVEPNPAAEKKSAAKGSATAGSEPKEADRS